MRRYLYILAALAVASCGPGVKEDTGTDNPSAPTRLCLHSSTETSLTFQWDQMEGAQSYSWVLYRGTDTENSGVVKTRNVTVDNLRKATEYTFSVRSVSGDYSSEASSIVVTTEGESTPVGPVVPPSFSGEYADFLIPLTEDADGMARAFPGAEGGGMYTTGGRGGSVYHVTSLEDSSNPAYGTLRYGIEKAGRPLTIVFDVAGVIALEKQLTVANGKLTIAGQTAPGDGICLKNYTLRINASDVIVRYLRCRMGDERKTEDDALNLYTGNNNIKDVIIDHCSLSWSTDECGSFYGVTNFTLQWCILSESLRISVHNKGKHGFGGLWGGENATYHHNLLAHHDSRNPRLDHDYTSTLKGPVSLVNNVIYNWGDNSTYGGESANDNGEYRKYNILNNYYKPGPATATSKYRFIDPWTKACSNCTGKTNSSTIVPGHYYMTGNVFHSRTDLSSDNWKGTTASDDVISVIKSDELFSYSANPTSVSMQSASAAFNSVTDYVGASLRRDKVDERISRETKEGKSTYTGSKGSTGGLIDTQSDVGGWPEYTAGDEEIALITDTDGDGIPDWFEDACKLDKDKASDGAYKTLDPKGRYTNLEMFLHYLVREITRDQNTDGIYTKL